ncbi:hypothetical protein KKC94_03335 [Patescibacteria group bacterium]|nr:hypothetical protein [Patescibacteria group bacterium]
MKRTWSNISGIPVISSGSNAPAGRLNGIFINPETGQIIAYLVGLSRVLSPVDVEKWTKDAIFITSPDVLVSPLEILRIQEFGLRRSLLMGKTVVSKSLRPLGRLRDFTIDTALDSLVSIECSRRFLWLQWSKRLFQFDNISEIEANRIIVNVDGNLAAAMA